jgi:hypothetical protein
MSIDPNSPGFPVEAARLLNIADAIDMGTVVMRYAREQKTTLPRAVAVAGETRRFLVLCAMNSEPYAVGGEVDSFWHTFVLFTARYAGFCDKVAGRFIHHVPGDDLPPDPAASKAQYAATLRDYRLAFGQVPDPSIWPATGSTNDDSDAAPCTVRDCVPAIGAKTGCIVRDCVPVVGKPAA